MGIAGYKCHVLAQALLEGISLSQPQPKIPSELIRFLGKTYSAWHIAIPLLESHVMLFPMARAAITHFLSAPCDRASQPSGFLYVATAFLLHFSLSSTDALRKWLLMSVGGGILQETRCFDCLAELYGMLNEDDVLFGLWKRRGAANETRAALSCIQHGMLVRGQDFLEEAINKSQAGAYSGGEQPTSRRICA